MQDQLFEYAVIRIVPKVEREEFMNVGVILYCAKQKFLQNIYHFDAHRMMIFCKETDESELHQNLEAMNRICNGSFDSGPIGKLDIAARFRWLTATRSTVIQTSKVHPGLCTDPSQTLIILYNKFVL